MPSAIFWRRWLFGLFFDRVGWRGMFMIGVLPAFVGGLHPHGGEGESSFSKRNAPRRPSEVWAF